MIGAKAVSIAGEHGLSNLIFKANNRYVPLPLHQELLADVVHVIKHVNDVPGTKSWHQDTICIIAAHEYRGWFHCAIG